LARRAARLDEGVVGGQRQITTETGLLALAAAISTVLVIVFATDLILAWPFQRHSLLMDVTVVLCGLVLATLSWSTYR
jgi:hypothetical protein